MALPAGLRVGAHELTARVFRDNVQVAGSAPLSLSIAALPVTPVPTAAPAPTTPPVPTAPPPTATPIAPAINAPTADSNGRWSFGLASSLPAGTHTLRSVVLDASGKEAARSPAVSIEIKSVEAPTILPVANGQLGIGAVVKGKAKPGSVVSIFDGDKLLGTATAGADGVWKFALPASLQAGVVNLRAAILNSTGAVLGQSKVTRVQITPSVLPASGGAKPGP